MLVFRYDKSFEGLLTAVFDAYFRKTFPERLASPDEPEPMFTTAVHMVYTDTSKASRVWEGVERKFTRRGCNMLLHVWLSEESGCDELLFRFIRKMFDSPFDKYADFGDNDAMAIKKLAQKVSKEGHYVKQFVRFQKAADGTYFAAMTPQYNALPLSVNFFRDRYHDQKWMIYDLKRNYGFYFDLEKVSEIRLEDADFAEGGRLDQKLLAADELQFQQLWQAYFKALTIKERINPRLHRQNMPRRFWKYLTEKQHF